jgi:hypothetical protein
LSGREAAAARKLREPDLFSYQAVELEQGDPAPLQVVTPQEVVAVAPENLTPLIAATPEPVSIIPDDQPLVVAVPDEAFAWFRAGEKSWELRRCGRQFNENAVVVGRAVEFRRGFRSDAALKGRIEQVAGAASIVAFFETAPYHEVIPVADSLEDAAAIAKRLLGPGAPGPVIGFRVELDVHDSVDSESQVRPPSAGKRQPRGR